MDKKALSKSLNKLQKGKKQKSSSRNPKFSKKTAKPKRLKHNNPRRKVPEGKKGKK